MTSRPRFHLAFPVRDLAATRGFYGGLLGCAEGRSAERWVDFDFFGHQISAHLAESSPADDEAKNEVDGDGVPVRHFGAILPPADWEALRDRLAARAVKCFIGPRTRFAGQPGEQRTLFVRDPDGHALEFKSFADDAMVFAVADAKRGES